MKVIRLKNSVVGGVFMLLILALVSCRPTYELGQVRAHGISDNKLYKHVVDSSLHYKTLFVKRFSAQYDINGKTQSLKGAIKILKDSIIMVQINAPTGILEVARVYITPDSVKLIDRLKKRYILSDFTYLSKKLNMNADFHTIQSILTNSIFQFRNKDEKVRPFARNFKSKVIDNKYVFISDKAGKVNRKLRKDKIWKLNKINYHRFEIDPSLMLITDILVKEFDIERDISLSYRDFIDVGKQKFPSELVFKVEDTIQSLSCKMKYNKLVIDQDLKFPFRISSKFKRFYPQ